MSEQLHVIIPSFNGLRYLKVLLPMLQKELAPYQHTLTIIDNGSVDGARDWLRQQSQASMYWRYIECPENLGFAKANNLAAYGSEAEYTLLLNQDIRPKERFLDRMISSLQDPGIAIVGCKLIHMQTDQIHHAGIVFIADGPDRGLPRERFRGMDARYSGANGTVELHAVTAACMLIRTSVFNELGGFCEDYVNGWEDTDLCIRARERGLRILYNGHAELYHDAESSPGRLDHDFQNKELFKQRWVNTGRIFPIIGMGV